MPLKNRNRSKKIELDKEADTSSDRTSLGGEEEEEGAANATSQAKEANILADVHSLREDFSAQTIATFTERLTSAETRISKTEDDISSLVSKEASLQNKVHKLTQKLDDLENRQRRSNLRLVGLPEGAEGGDVVSFLQTWLLEILGPDAFQNPPMIERAHRLPGQQNPNASARVMIAKFLNYQDKMRVMKAACQKGKVMHQGHHIMFFPDLSTEVQKQRSQINGAKQQLQTLNTDFGLIFPAMMRVFHQGNRHFFNTPAEVEEFIRHVHQQQKD